MASFVRMSGFTITILELGQAIALVMLFGCAYVNDYRETLWKVGGAHGWNSDPTMRVYFYANYQEPPPIPAIWDESSTKTNLCVAVFTTTIWIIRLKVNCLQGHGLGIYTTLATNGLYDMFLIGLWTYSAVLQSSGDFSDSEHISTMPWYLEHGCEEVPHFADAACRMAKASYKSAVFVAIWFGFRLLSTCMYGAFWYGRHSNRRSDIIEI